MERLTFDALTKFIRKLDDMGMSFNPLPRAESPIMVKRFDISTSIQSGVFHKELQALIQQYISMHKMPPARITISPCIYKKIVKECKHITNINPSPSYAYLSYPLHTSPYILDDVIIIGG